MAMSKDPKEDYQSLHSSYPYCTYNWEASLFVEYLFI
jgi:hypothetical protein